MDAVIFRSATEPDANAPDQGSLDASYGRRAGRGTRRPKPPQPKVVSDLGPHLPVTEDEIRLLLAVLGDTLRTFLEPEHNTCMIPDPPPAA